MQAPAQIGVLGYGQIYQSLLLALQSPDNKDVAGVTHYSYPLLHLGDVPSSSEVSTLPELAAHCDLLIVATDTWEPRIQQGVNLYCQETARPWLSIYTEFGNAILGPLVLPGSSGCSTCATLRRQNAQEQVDIFTQSRASLAMRSKDLSPADCWLTPFAMQILIELLSEEVRGFLCNPVSARTCNAFFQVRLDSLAIQHHTFLPEPRCPDCGAFTHLFPQDAAELALISLQEQRKLSLSTYRVRALTDEKAHLTQSYVSTQSGIIRALTKDASNLFANFVVYINVQDGQRQEVGIGRSFDFEQSYVGAIAEAVERYGGIRPGGKRTVVRASFKELGEQALDPRELGIYTREQYSQPGFPYVEYTDDLVFNWVWGYSFQHQRPILVPEQCVYYGLHYWSKEKPFIYEISNGCALGGCLEEAILHGTLEVAERDAFLMTWYAQLPVARIDPSSARDPLIGLLIERIYHLTGYTVYAFNVTLEHGIPCFWVMGVDEQYRSDKPRAICAAGSHLQPEKALINALQELAPIIGQHMGSYARERERALAMIDNPYLVAKMQDHSLLYSLPEVFERLEFLYHTPRQQTFAEAFPPDSQMQPRSDLRADLEDLIARYARTGIDTIVVDQTTPEHRVSNLHCVKVLLPGTLPMTFGYHARRVSGFERLYKLPYQLGYRSHILTDAHINPYPHPFP